PLFSASTYQVTAEIVQAVTSMYRTTAEGEPVLRASEMPSQTGFAYLDEPLTFTDAFGGANAIPALSWGRQLFAPGDAQPTKGVRITTWTDANLSGARGSALSLYDSTLFVPYGKPISAVISDDPTRWLHCLWLFMDTEIIQAARDRAERSARRRAE